MSLLATGGSPPEVLAYLAAWVVGSTFPGVMVWRLVAGPSTLACELGFGSVLGIVLQLLIWAAATLVHQSWLMLLLPAGVAAAFGLVPRLRKHWRPHRTVQTRTPLLWHVAMAGVMGLAFYRLAAERLSNMPLPPTASELPRDTWWNSAVAYELGRTLRPQDPFVVGEPLRYHWFADAHVTATAQLSGAPIAHAMIALWFVPMLAVCLMAVAAAASHFLNGSDRWWVGPAAALFTLVTPAVWQLSDPGLSRTTSGFVVGSPSGVLALTLILALSGPVLDLLHGRGRPGTWLVLALLLGCSAGTKPSILPVVAFGAALVVAVDLIRARRLNRPMLVVVAASALLVLVASPVLIGSTGGSHFQFFALLTSDPSYARLLGGRPVLPGAGGWILPAVADGQPNAVPIVVMLLLLWTLTELPRLLCLAGLAVAPLRRDPGVVWGAGVVTGGWGGMWVLAHSGYGQHYFWTVTVAMATVVVVTNAARLLPKDQRARAFIAPLAMMALPAVLTVALLRTRPPVDLAGTTASIVLGRLGPYAVLLGVGLATTAAMVVLRRVGRVWSLPLLTAVTAFALAAALPSAVTALRNESERPGGAQPRVGVNFYYVSAEQQRAALWLNQHSPSAAVVATNMFCWPMGRDVPACQTGFTWLSGLSGRRLVLGDWAYSSATTRNYTGIGRVDQQPSPWPERQELSLAAVRTPSPAVLDRLTRDYGASWLFVDTRASKVSPRLEDLTILRYRSSYLRIYQLRSTYS
jgi:hypothetical protein